MFCEVRVNAITGETRVSRFLGSFDCGRILNAKTAASQFRGGIIMGLGLALMEETQFDERNGRIMNPSLAEYHVPVHLDVPEIDVIWTDIPDPHTPMGARGIGEIGITGVGAAVANAVYNATGKRVRDLPITLDKLLLNPVRIGLVGYGFGGRYFHAPFLACCERVRVPPRAWSPTSPERREAVRPRSIPAPRRLTHSSNWRRPAPRR